MSATDDVMKDLVWTATRAAVALDRAEWNELLASAKRIEEHGMALARVATRHLTSVIPPLQPTADADAGAISTLEELARGLPDRHPDKVGVIRAIDLLRANG